MPVGIDRLPASADDLQVRPYIINTGTLKISISTDFGLSNGSNKIGLIQLLKEPKPVLSRSILPMALSPTLRRSKRGVGILDKLRKIRLRSH